MAHVHMSEAELTRDLHAVLAGCSHRFRTRTVPHIFRSHRHREAAGERPRLFSHPRSGLRRRPRRNRQQPRTLESALVGLILDTSTLITAERRGQSVAVVTGGLAIFASVAKLVSKLSYADPKYKSDRPSGSLHRD